MMKIVIVIIFHQDVPMSRESYEKLLEIEIKIVDINFRQNRRPFLSFCFISLTFRRLRENLNLGTWEGDLKVCLGILARNSVRMVEKTFFFFRFSFVSLWSRCWMYGIQEYIQNRLLYYALAVTHQSLACNLNK